MNLYLYKITNKINGKIYIGVHKTNDLNDGYMGSGKYLMNAIKKYGIDNFEKEILEWFDTKEEMFEKEAEIVNEEFVNRKDTYNITCGGKGGWWICNINSKLQSQKAIKSNKAQKEIYYKNKEWVEKRSKKISQCNKEQWENGERTISDNFRYSFKGRKHSINSKRKIAEKNSVNQQGTGNSQYGTCWIHNFELKENKKVKKENLPYWLDKGWIKGRKMKF